MKNFEKYVIRRDQYETILRTKTHLSYDDINKYSFQQGADWSRKDLLEEIKLVKNELNIAAEGLKAKGMGNAALNEAITILNQIEVEKCD